ncbi:AEC family transporter [Paracoccus nototheniae]|uniref:AEC family transporter n=1 Tax=Paracoccus nototheniae TaxID=2489002 RepID=A0ABW4DZ96_9RHOB|nr:AEC family transporter [Paracoccus nototheniae]
MTAALSILPVIALVALGHLARRGGLIPAASWPGIEQLGYRVLFPAILLTSIYRSELSIGRLGPYLGALALAFALTGGLALVWALSRAEQGPRASSLFQGALRFNSLLILAVAAQAFGARALGDLAVAFAFLIPAFNIAAIIALTLLSDGPRPAGALRRIGAEVSRNPMVLSCLAGLALNLSGIVLPGWVMAPLDWLGQGALAVGLLAVGAGIEIRHLWQRDLSLWLGVGLRLAICPVIFLGAALVLGLPGGQLASGLLATAAPGAPVGYILARQMGGDADFYAAIFTWQTVLAALSLPLWLVAAGFFPA